MVRAHLSDRDQRIILSKSLIYGLWFATIFDHGATYRYIKGQRPSRKVPSLIVFLRQMLYSTYNTLYRQLSKRESHHTKKQRAAFMSLPETLYDPAVIQHVVALPLGSCSGSPLLRNPCMSGYRPGQEQGQSILISTMLHI
jgi:hypothetical protein